MKRAGVDLGCSLTKVVFKKDDGTLAFFSTADCSLKFIVQELLRNGVTELNVCGINKIPKNFVIAEFKINRASGNLIDNEIEFQAIGARELLKISRHDIKDFLLVSIGTGTSYTFVRGASSTRFPIGNSLGGGFLLGLGKQLGIEAGLWNLDGALEIGEESLDLLVKDLIVETAGTPTGDLIVANFGKIDCNDLSSYLTKQHALLNVVATAVSRDIIILSMLRGLTSKYVILWLIGFLLKMNSKSNSIVVIGSVAQKSFMLRKMLTEHCSKHLGTMPIFPENSAFALAIGAYLK